MTTLLRVAGLTKHFAVRHGGALGRGHGLLRAVDDVSFDCRLPGSGRAASGKPGVPPSRS